MKEKRQFPEDSWLGRVRVFRAVSFLYKWKLFGCF